MNRHEHRSRTLGTRFRGRETLAQSQNTDPSTFLQYLRGASGEVTEVGKERLGGADTTWYSLSVDVEKAAADAPAEQRATIRQNLFEVLASLRD